MKYLINSSLQQMALVRTAIALWNQVDIRNLIANYEYLKHFPYCYQEWQEVVDRVMEKVFQLPLPNLLKKNLTSLINLIGRQIMSWYAYHRKECLILSLPGQFCWTPEGRIDRKRTAEMLIKDEIINVEACYKLACNNCLEDQLPELWNQIPKHQRLRYYANRKTKGHWLVQFWTNRLFSKPELVYVNPRNTGSRYPPHVYTFLEAVRDGNLSATEFFFYKLSDEERVTLFVKCIGKMFGNRWHTPEPKEYYSETFFFLHSKMSGEQQLRALRSYPRHVLAFFLEFPFQSFFLDSAEQVTRLIKNDQYEFLVQEIINKFQYFGNDYDYRRLFCDFWKLRPQKFRVLTLYCPLVSQNLLTDGEEDLFKSMVEDEDPLDKKKLILSGSGRGYCEKLVCFGCWDLLDWLVRHCVPSKEVMVQFKESFMERYSTVFMNDAKYQRNWSTFFQLLDNLMEQKTNKRKAEDDHYYSAENV